VDFRRTEIDAVSKHGEQQSGPVVDGYFFPAVPTAIFAAGEQGRVPLFVGWNSQESGAGGASSKDPLTVVNFTNDVAEIYQGQQILGDYPAPTDSDVMQAVIDLASEGFIAYCA
jgi:para-nitrobenzyl esterase